MAEFRVVRSTLKFDEMVEFYGGKLGLAVHRSWDEGSRGILFECNGALVEFLECRPDSPPEYVAGVMISVETDDAGALHDRLAGEGVAATDPLSEKPWGHLSFTIRDPDGMPITFFQVL
ncbi:MAG TPA: VOC family protein [Acidimicrobiales bacterium]|nr:VOC family protein [Acidimicrobiales bacterium]